MAQYDIACDIANTMSRPRHPRNAKANARGTGDLLVETEGQSATTHQQLFSFPKPPTQECPSSPLFHLRMDADSRRGSHRLETPPLTAESSPAFATFLQRRPSTSISAGDVTTESSRTLLATSPSNAAPDHHPLESPLAKLDGEPVDHCKSEQAAPSQSQERKGSWERTESTRVQTPFLKASSARVVPLFVFLRKDGLSENVAREGILEWIVYWVNQGVRVRKLARDLDIIKEEVRL